MIANSFVSNYLKQIYFTKLIKEIRTVKTVVFEILVVRVYFRLHIIPLNITFKQLHRDALSHMLTYTRSG